MGNYKGVTIISAVLLDHGSIDLRRVLLELLLPSPSVTLD